MEIRVVTSQVKIGVSKLVAIKYQNIYCVLVYSPNMCKAQ